MEKQCFHLLVPSSYGNNGQGWASLEPPLGLPHGQQGAKHLSHLLLCQAHYQGAGLELNQLDLKLGLIGHTSVAGYGLIHCITTSIPLQALFVFQLSKCSGPPQSHGLKKQGPTDMQDTACACVSSGPSLQKTLRNSQVLASVCQSYNKNSSY